MAKKKVKQQAPGLSPEKYIRTKARNLPIAECLITAGWQEAGECNIFVARKHSNGNYTIGGFLVDTFCVGVKDCFYKFNVSEEDYEEIRTNDAQIPIGYNEAHNIIFGALAYAEDLGIAPHKDFAIAQYILEEDTDEIPLIEYEFGHNGKPLLIARNRNEAGRYLPALRRSVGDDFDFMIGDGGYEEEDDDFGENDDYDEYEELDDESDDDEYDHDNTVNFSERLNEISANMQRMHERHEKLTATEYAYVHQEYPKELKLNHEAELQVFFSPDHANRLDKEQIDKILSLPSETLIEDLEHLILYEIGQTCGEIPSEMWDKPYITPITHALLFLGELKSEKSLDTVLEILRQNEPFREFHFGDSACDALSLTLYYVGRNQLPKLTEFAKEPGLNIHLKIYIFDSIAMIAMCEPERRSEVIDRFGEIIDFYSEKVEDSAFFDSGLTGLMTSNLLDIKAVELLPKIERLYATGQVDEMCCGDYPEIVNEMASQQKPLHDYSLMNIYERYKDISRWSNE